MECSSPKHIIKEHLQANKKAGNDIFIKNA